MGRVGEGAPVILLLCCPHHVGCWPWTVECLFNPMQPHHPAWGCAQAGNAADPLRYAFIVSQAELVSDAAEAASASFSKAAELEGIGAVTIGVLRAEGAKCSRWGARTRFLLGRLSVPVSTMWQGHAYAPCLLIPCTFSCM